MYKLPISGCVKDRGVIIGCFKQIMKLGDASGSCVR